MDFVGEKVASLGKGRFASVDCYRRASDKKLVAIKHYPQFVDFKTKILNELHILLNIKGKSPYILELIESVQNGQFLYFITEVYCGGPLSKHIQHSPNNKIDIHVVQLYMAELFSALHHLEQAKCLHRDIKSSNCILDHNGRLKLCDFGSAKLFNFSNAKSPFKTYTITGTAHCMAPEMVAIAASNSSFGQREPLFTYGYSHSIDYWACGVMLYELTAGHIPHWNRKVRSIVDSWPNEYAGYVALQGIMINRAVSTDIVPPDATTLMEEVNGSWYIDFIDKTYCSTNDNCNTSNVSNSALEPPPQPSNDVIICNSDNTLSVATPSSSSSKLIYEAIDLVRILLTIDPVLRYNKLLAIKNQKTIKLESDQYDENAINNSRTDACFIDNDMQLVGGDDDDVRVISWSSVVRFHPFFVDIDWTAIDAGSSNRYYRHNSGCTDSDDGLAASFDRRLGCMELLAEFDRPEDIISEADQSLFANF